MTEEKKHKGKNKIEKEAAEEVKEKIIESVERGGVPEKIAEKEEKIDEKETAEFEAIEKKTEEVKKDIKKKIKKNEAVVNGKDIPASTKESAAICNFIKGKSIGEAIKDLEEVTRLRKPIPMKGEIPHRKGNLSSGRFPVRASKNFIFLLKSLSANASVNDLDNPIIFEAVANIASRPFGKFGRVRKKRTHIRIVARNRIVGGRK